MRRFFAVLAVAASALVAIPAASAQVTDLLSFEAAFDQIAAFDPAIRELQPATPPEPGYEFTVGSLKETRESGAFSHARFAAHDGPNGPSGSVRVTAQSLPFFGSFDVKGRVVCVQVDVNAARVAALLDEQTANGATHVTLIVVDFGNPVGGTSPDRVFVGFTSAPPANCADFGFNPVGDSRGSVIVRDDT